MNKFLFQLYYEDRQPDIPAVLRSLADLLELARKSGQPIKGWGDLPGAKGSWEIKEDV